MTITAGGDGLPAFDLSDVTPRVLAHGLARTNRFSGQPPKPFSDAEHSVNLAEWLGRLGHPTPTLRYALIHDASECLGFGDPHGGVKRAFASDLRLAEGELLRALDDHLPGYSPFASRQTVSEYDRLIGEYEAFQFGFHQDVSDPRLGVGMVLPRAVQFWCPEVAERRWLRAWLAVGG